LHDGNIHKEKSVVAGFEPWQFRRNLGLKKKSGKKTFGTFNVVPKLIKILILAELRSIFSAWNSEIMRRFSLLRKYKLEFENSPG